MEVWEVASILGLAQAPKDEQPAQLEGAALVEERMRRHRAGLPPPEARPPSEAQMARLSTLLPTAD